MLNPYEILGVSKSADDKAIKHAYRQLARETHPDLHPNDKTSENRFKEIKAAYDLLKDSEKRAAFDRSEMDADGMPHPSQTYYRTWAEGSPGGKYHDPDETFRNFGGDEIFADLFRSAGLGGRNSGTVRLRGADAHYRLDVEFLDAIKGSVSHLSLPEGKRLNVTIPPASADGQVLRLKGQGGPGLNGGPAGDAMIELHIRPHPLFRCQGPDILLDLPVTLYEAVLGGKIEVPTIDGTVTMSVPKGSNSGSRLRLKGKGVPVRGLVRGDQYVTLTIFLPDPPDPALECLIAEWTPTHSYDVRGKEKVQ